jgi:hypothetical protein
VEVCSSFTNYLYSCVQPVISSIPSIVVFRAPGFAPIADACGLAGGTPWTALAPEEGQYVNTTHAHHGMKGTDLPPLDTGTVWKAGGEAEVVMAIKFNHGGNKSRTYIYIYIYMWSFAANVMHGSLLYIDTVLYIS